MHQGEFQAPCDSTIAYFTPMRLPTLAHYRWHAIYDHLTQGNCADEDQCGRGAMEWRSLTAVPIIIRMGGASFSPKEGR